MARHLDILVVMHTVANPDVSQHKLFIRGLDWDTTTDVLHSLFSTYEDLKEVVIILDKATSTGNQIHASPPSTLRTQIRHNPHVMQ